MSLLSSSVNPSSDPSDLYSSMPSTTMNQSPSKDDSSKKAKMIIPKRLLR